MLERRTMRLRSFKVGLVVVAASSLAVGADAQLAPLPYDQGATGLGLALRRLPVAARVLYVTAHPDDEHNGVLAALSRGRGVRTALLTVTRGDGGQNAIGPELFEALGALRTEELLALHRYDGAQQFFTRAYEFGFSFSVEETLAKWGHEETLGDVVRVVRLFRPDVILTLPVESADEHAHHLSSARLAREAFRAAADPARFPEQLRAGSRPWQARKFYSGETGGSQDDLGPGTVAVVTGVYDPLLGMSWQELGSLARAQHRSQGASQIKVDPLQGRGTYVLADSEPMVREAESDLLDGIDASLAGLRRFAAPGAGTTRLATELLAIEVDARSALDTFDARAPERSLPPLRAGTSKLEALLAGLEALGLDAGARAELEPRLRDKRDEFAEAMRLAHGLSLSASPSDDLVTAGQAFQVKAGAHNQGRDPLSVESISLDAPRGWTVTRRAGGEPQALAPGSSTSATFDVTVSPDARPSQPYWRRAAGRDRYDLDQAEHESLPWAPPALRARLHYRSGEAAATAVAPVASRYEGRWTGGEKQKELSVVPALSLRLNPPVAVMPLAPARAKREFRVTVTSNAPGAAEALVRLEAPAGFALQPRSAKLSFRREGDEQSASFTLTAPAGLRPGTGVVRAVAVMDGREYRMSEQVVAYDHVQERRLYREAAAVLQALDVRVAPGVSVGFVPGVGDDLPEALRQLGVPVTVVKPEELSSADLSRFTTVVTGVRAYTDKSVRGAHARLMAFVEGGGNLVVQYNRGEFNQSGPAVRAVMGAGLRPESRDSPFAPFPASTTTARVSAERAPLRVLQPGHPLLTTPNAIGPADWEGWVQERAIQLLDARDPRYVELLASEDPFPRNAGEKKGLLVEAQVGRGTWTYVGLVLFRQLPAGTPGAYRLLANLVSRPRGR